MTTTTQAVSLSETHRQYLLDHAITNEIIEAEGVRSEKSSLVFSWHDGEKVTEQSRPWPGEAGIYYWEAGEDLHFNVLRDPGPLAPVLLCEGTKQSLAVASWAPPEYAVYGMPGCWGWGKCDLERFAGRDVLVLLDADAASNLDVYEAGEKLAENLDLEDARVSFVRTPAQGTDGIDDYLAKLAPSRRTPRLEKLIERAGDRPAERRPTRRKVAQTAVPDTGGRPGVAVNRDRKEVIDQILAALKEKWDGTEIFDFGGALTRLRGAATEPLEKGPFLRLLVEAVAPFHYTEATSSAPARFEPTWPDDKTIGAVLSSAEEFAPLSRVVQVPFLRPDGTVCSKAGYDAATGTMLVTENGMDRLTIPDTPTEEETQQAAELLLDEWLGDMPFHTPADRANALALVLTPFVRGSVPLVPLAVVSGLQMGVGKNLLADCLATLTTGRPAAPLPYIEDEDETRKQITSAFRSGTDLFVFDEAHVIQGTQFARAITSLTYQDRVLGVSRMISFPNQVTWMSLGNQVQVNSDMARRVYFIELHPDCPDPQDRGAEAFRHPELREWTLANRPELTGAALTVIRSWYAAGCPPHPRGSSMGSFETWDRMMSGILAHAGVGGFLENLAERRGESDFTGSLWSDHVAWLYRTFGTGDFTTAKVKETAISSLGTWEAPPGMEDPMEKGYSRKLGQSYARIKNRWFGPHRLIKKGVGHNNTVKWGIMTQMTKEMGVTGVTTGVPLPSCSAELVSVLPASNVDTSSAYRRSGGHPPIPPVTPTEKEPNRGGNVTPVPPVTPAPSPVPGGGDDDFDWDEGL